MYTILQVIGMSKKEKLINRLISRPSDFEFSELITLLGYFDYTVAKSGKTSGSKVTFEDGEGDYLRIHKPHPRKILKHYQIDDIITSLKERGKI